MVLPERMIGNIARTTPNLMKPAINVDISRRNISFLKSAISGTARSEARQAQTGSRL
jgi:hypothetical protein